MKTLNSYFNFILENYYRPKFFLILALLFLGLLIYISSTYTFIGRGDYANYSNVARSLVAGRGFSVDYIAWHYLYYPQVSHPEDMWPLLQPVWIALSYLVLGVTPMAARVPNAIFLFLVVVMTYFIGRKLFSAKVGFWGAVLSGLNVHLIKYSTDWITSDIALALFSLVIFYLGYQVILDAQKGKTVFIKLFLLGIFSGLATLQKPMGVLLPVIYFLYLAYFYRHKLKKFVRPGTLFFFATMLVTAPFFARNLILFGTLFLPIEHYLGYQIKYFPYEDIFAIYYGHPPSLQLWLNYGWLEFLKVNFRYLRYGIDTFVYKDLLMPYTVIVLSLLSLRNQTDKSKHFFGPLIILFIVMSILMGTYWHYESRYYSMLIPVFNLLAAACFFELFPKINWKNISLVMVIVFITFLPSLKAVLEGVKTKPIDRSLVAYNWIKNNTPQEAVILTLTPWELNFHSERRAVVIPNENLDTILWMAKKYHIDYLELEFLSEIKREAIKDLYAGKDTPIFKPIYQDPANVYIYKIDWSAVHLNPDEQPYWF